MRSVFSRGFLFKYTTIRKTHVFVQSTVLTNTADQGKEHDPRKAISLSTARRVKEPDPSCLGLGCLNPAHMISQPRFILAAFLRRGGHPGNATI